MIAVALWYGLDPDIVEGWTMPSFLNRQEFMWVRKEYQKDPDENAPYKLKPGETIYTRKKKQ